MVHVQELFFIKNIVKDILSNDSLGVLEIMEELNLTQKVLAERMGCTQQYISKIVKGRENLSWESICKLEKVLGTQILRDFYPD